MSYKASTRRFLLADDHHIVRQGMQMMIKDLVDDAEVLHAASLQQIQEVLQKEKVDIAILDAQLPDGNCLTILPDLKAIQPDLKILIFTSFEEDKLVLRFIKAGANGFLSKQSEEEVIEDALYQMMNHGTYFSPLTQKLLERSTQQPEMINPLVQLSERELQITDLFVKGYGNLEIANELSLKQNTISTFKKKIFEKLNIKTFVELIEIVNTYQNLKP